MIYIIMKKESLTFLGIISKIELLTTPGGFC